MIRGAPGSAAVRAGIEETDTLFGKGVVSDGRKEVAFFDFGYLNFTAAGAGVAADVPGPAMIIAVDQRRIERLGPDVSGKNQAAGMRAFRQLNSVAWAGHEVGAFRTKSRIHGLDISPGGPTRAFVIAAAQFQF